MAGMLIFPFLVAWVYGFPSDAQNVTCTTRPPGDNSNACASTAFVDTAIAGISFPTLPLSIVNGGTGTSTPNLTAGTNVTISGMWPNQTISATGGGAGSGTVSSGSQGQTAYYLSNGTTVAGLPGAVNVFTYFTSPQITDVTTKACTQDVSSAMNVALAAANYVYFPAGLYCMTAPLIINTGQHIIGDGQYATTFQAKTAATALLQTVNYSTLLNGGSAGGPYGWVVEKIAFDGNRTHVTGEANNIQIFGYNYTLRDVLTENAPATSFDLLGNGLFSQWGPQAAVPVSGGGDSMEAHLTNVKAYNNARDGFWFEGPSDTHLMDILSELNGYIGLECLSSAGVGGAQYGCGLHGSNIQIYASGLLNLALNSTPGSTWGSVANLNNLDIGVAGNVPCIGGCTAAGGIYTANHSELRSSTIATYSNHGYGIYLSSNNNYIGTINSASNTTAGISIGGSGNIISNAFSIGNGTQGLTIFGGTLNQVNAVTTQQNGADGIDVSSANNIISSCLNYANTGYGVDMSAASYVIGCRSTSNVAGTYLSSGGATLVNNY